MKKVTLVFLAFIGILLTACTEQEVTPSTNGGITHEDTWNTQT